MWHSTAIRLHCFGACRGRTPLPAVATAEEAVGGGGDRSALTLAGFARWGCARFSFGLALRSLGCARFASSPPRRDEEHHRRQEPTPREANATRRPRHTQEPTPHARAHADRSTSHAPTTPSGSRPAGDGGDSDRIGSRHRPSGRCEEAAEQHEVAIQCSDWQW